MTLDTKRTFDALVEKHAEGPAARRRILENRYHALIEGMYAAAGKSHVA